jgi:hypothetical protein
LERYQPLRLHIPSSEPHSNLLNERIYDGTLTAEEPEAVHNVFGNPTNHSIFNTSEGVDNPGVFESTSGGLQPAHITTSSAPRKIDTGTSYPVTRTAPHANITMEMPKYSHELSKQGLRLFIRRYELWAAAKRMNDHAAKLAFPLAFKNCTAQQYFLIHDGDLMHESVTWNAFIQRFLQNCPMEVTEGTSFIKILGKQQQPDENGSIFVQRIR